MTGQTAVCVAPRPDGAWEPVSLEELAARLIDHRHVPVPVDRRLRVGAVIGLAVVAVFGAVVRLGGQATPARRPGVFLFGWRPLRAMLWGQPHATVMFWLAAAVSATGAVAAAISLGFRRVRPSLLPAVFALVVLGVLAGAPLLVAAFIVLANVATWLAIGVLCVALGAALLLMLLLAASG